MLILSITGNCNLRCAGCYSHKLGFSKGKELDCASLVRILGEAAQLGIGTVLIAGGEPLIRAVDVWTLAGLFPRTLFAVFTNGLLLNAEAAKRIRGCGNIVPVVSLEGGHDETDRRRGPGVFGRIAGALDTLRSEGIFYGLSITVTKSNFPAIFSPGFLDSLANRGCGLLFFVEYVPVEEGSEGETLDETARADLVARVAEFRRRKGVLCVAFPGEEEQFGGCLAAGRGFVHISPSGLLEPCPFAPYSDANLNSLALVDGLKSPLLAAIRANHAQLQETRGGCALWNQREWVSSLTKS